MRVRLKKLLRRPFEVLPEPEFKCSLSLPLPELYLSDDVAITLPHLPMLLTDTLVYYLKHNIYKPFFSTYHEDFPSQRRDADWA
jgi:hypothetical protein